MATTFLALGSNLGDRERYLRDAIQDLDAAGVRVMRRARLYSTEPRDVTNQPWFLNTVIEAATDLDPNALLRVCLGIELKHRRVRDQEKGPRTLDIDIILYENRIVQTAELTVPHPRFRDRRFVLQPLAELAPEFVDPVTGRSIRDLLASVADESRVEWHREGSGQ